MDLSSLVLVDLSSPVLVDIPSCVDPSSPVLVGRNLVVATAVAKKQYTQHPLFSSSLVAKISTLRDFPG